MCSYHLDEKKAPNEVVIQIIQKAVYALSTLAYEDLSQSQPDFISIKECVNMVLHVMNKYQSVAIKKTALQCLQMFTFTYTILEAGTKDLLMNILLNLGQELSNFIIKFRTSKDLQPPQLIILILEVIISYATEDRSKIFLKTDSIKQIISILQNNQEVIRQMDKEVIHHCNFFLT